MKDASFESILKDEMALFYNFIKLSVVDHDAYRRTLADLDRFLINEGITEKEYDADMITKWLDSLQNHKLRYKKMKLGHIRKLSAYLLTLGVKTSIPELPKVVDNFEPYVFTSEEMSRIFELADDMAGLKQSSRIAAEFPMMLRLLYGCGLRLGEAIALTWDDMDLENGVIAVRIAKNRKQRLVVMGDELTRIFKMYKATPAFNAREHGYVFTKKDGNPRTNGAYWHLFSSMLCDLGIKNIQTAKSGDRGPCIHSLRHTFAVNAFQKLHSESCGLLEAAPLLSTYLGHERLLETDKYLKARHELYTDSHDVIADYTSNVFPEDI